MNTIIRTKYLELYLVFLILVVCGACAQTPTGPKPTAPVRGIDQPLEREGLAITVLEARTRQNYQTHYIMTHAEPHFLFYEVILQLEGAETPGQALEWGKQNLELGYMDDIQELELARWTIVGEDIEYKAGENFEYQFVYIYKVPDKGNFEDYYLQVTGGQKIALGRVYEKEGKYSVRPTDDLALGPGANVVGELNLADAPYATVSGGSHNRAGATHATVCGGELNVANAAYAFIGGGRENQATNFYTTIGGGFANTASGRDSIVSGGSRNTADNYYATVGGGIQNQATSSNTTIAGGAYNQASELYATICGGTHNNASGYGAYVGGGGGNFASGDHAASTGGLNNRASGNYATISGGYGNSANGAYAAIPGGASNQANGDFSLAAGNRATIHSDHAGVFLFADAVDQDFNSASSNEFAVRASGGVRFVSAIEPDGSPLSGVILPAGGGSWASLSDRTTKTKLSMIDGNHILAGLDQLPITTWSYLGQDDSIRHIGPMAGDFYAAFGLGEDSHYINNIDADGIALAAIQGLYRRLQDKEAQIEAQQREIDDLEQRLIALEKDQEGQRSNVLPITIWIGLIILVIPTAKTFFARLRL